jgi:hypothetical protein
VETIAAPDEACRSGTIRPAVDQSKESTIMTTSRRREVHRVVHSLTSSVRGWHLAVAAAVYAPLAALMFGTWIGSLTAVRRACGLSAFDVRAWWTVQDARTMLSGCGQAGRTAYLHQQILDLAYPAALAALLLASTALLIRRYGARWWPVVLPAVAMTVLDYVENAGIWTLLLDWPDIHPVMTTVAGAATGVKRILGFVAFSTPLALALVTLAATIHQRGRRIRLAGQLPDADRL